jgi:hypothetical protein
MCWWSWSSEVNDRPQSTRAKAQMVRVTNRRQTRELIMRCIQRESRTRASVRLGCSYYTGGVGENAGSVRAWLPRVSGVAMRARRGVCGDLRRRRVAFPSGTLESEGARFAVGCGLEPVGQCLESRNYSIDRRRRRGASSSTVRGAPSGHDPLLQPLTPRPPILSARVALWSRTTRRAVRGPAVCAAGRGPRLGAGRLFPSVGACRRT